MELSQRGGPARGIGLVALLLAVLAMLVAGCGGSSDDGGGNPGVPARTIAGRCTPKGTMVMGLEDEPSTIFALTATSTVGSVRLGHLVFAMLVELDKDGNPSPALASRWDVASDGLTYTFTLDPRAQWDDGTPVTSSDVAFTLRTLQDLQINPDFWGRIASVDASRPDTVVLHLREPIPGLLLSLANPNDGTNILPEHLLRGRSLDRTPLGTRPIGDGPFRVTRWVRGDRVELERNPNYFGAGRPCLERIVARFMPDPNSRKIAFDSGEVDYLYSYMLPLEDLARYENDPNASIVQGGLGTGPVDFIVLNTRNRYLQDQNVRQAIAYAVDRDQMNALAFVGHGKVAHSTISSVVNGYFNGTHDPYAHDEDKANELLDQAGFKAGSDGKRFALSVMVRPDRPFEKRIADVLKTQLGRVGIDLTVKATDPANIATAAYTRFDFDMVIQLRTTGPDPSTLLPVMFSRSGIGIPGGNAPQYVNPKLEQLFKQARVSNDAAERTQLWDQIQQITMQAVTWLPLVEYPNLQLISSKFGNVIVGPLDYLGNLEYAREVG